YMKAVANYSLKIITLAVVYHLAARVGLKMAYVQYNTSPVWPPTGIALAALLIFGYNIWPGISLGVLLGSLLTGADPVVAVGITIANTLEALAGAYLLKRVVKFHNFMDRIRDVVGLGVVSLFSAAISATFGTITLMLVGQADTSVFWAIWSTWWVGNLLGALVVTPALLVWANPPSLRSKTRHYMEGFILLTLLAFVTWYVFGSKPPDGIFHQALIYLVFPFIIWAALRLEQHGVTLAIFFVSGIAIWGTVQELGPFWLESMNDSLVLLQTFTGVISLTALILAAATIERRNATQEVQRRAEELSTLSDSSGTFLDNFEISSIYHTICRLAVTRLGLDAAWIEAPSREGGETRSFAAHGMPVEAMDIQKKKWEREAQSQSVVIETIDDVLDGKDITYQAYAAFPLTFSNHPIGALKMLSRRKDFFSEDKQILIQSFANLAAVAIQNAWLFDEARTTNRQLHALSQRLMKAQEEERLHLSRELHDESGQLLAALTVALGLLERDVENPVAIHTRTAELKRTANMIQENLHRLAVNLRPASLDHLGLVTALGQFIQEFSRQNNIKVEFEAVGMTDKRLPIEIETALFRIVQESLTNVLLHAKATRVDVLLSRTTKGLSVIVEDDGVGFIPTSAMAEDQIGLFGMRERVGMLGGMFTIESTLGKGTTVRAEVPSHD
ncbi:MAG: GAF domain-containing protein, partial [Chloroflexi bacterium]